MSDPLADFRVLLANDPALNEFSRTYLPALQKEVQDKYGVSVSAQDLVALPSVRINVLNQNGSSMDVRGDVESIPAVQKGIAERELLRSIGDPRATGHDQMAAKLADMRPDERIAYARANNIADVSAKNVPEISDEERATLLAQLEVVQSPSERLKIARKLGLS